MAHTGKRLTICIWLTITWCGEQQVSALEENLENNQNETGISDFVEDKLLNRIAFGSCMNGMFVSKKWYNQPQVVWKQIQEHQPDLWIWLGDAAYADTRVLTLVWKSSPLSLMAKYFRRQKEHPDYQEFQRSGIRILGIWDDHDYGMNDGGKDMWLNGGIAPTCDWTIKIHFSNRLQSQDMYLDFIDEPANSLRRKREGLYVSYTFGQGDKAVKLILLDVRSFAVSGKECDLLGSQQWQWLTEQLSDSTPVAFTIIASGIQILSNAPLIQNWEDCPQSYDRLIWLTRQREKVIYLSGDVHFAEISCLNSFSSGYPIYELTSSGLYTACSVAHIKPGLCKWFIRYVFHNDFRIKDPVAERNFGFIEIDWNSKPIQIKLQIFGERNNIVLEFSFNLDHIQKRQRAENCLNLDSKTTSTKPYIFWLLLSLVILAILAVSIALFCCLCKHLRGLVGYFSFWKSTNDERIKEKSS